MAYYTPVWYSIVTTDHVIQVTEAHKRHGTPPHCIFAVDNLVHRAVSEVLSIVSPGSHSIVIRDATIYRYIAIS